MKSSFVGRILRKNAKQNSAKMQNKLPQKYKIKWRKNAKFDCILRVAAV